MQNEPLGCVFNFPPEKSLKRKEFINFLEILIEFEENRFGTTEQFDAIQWKNIERCQKCQEFW